MTPTLLNLKHDTDFAVNRLYNPVDRPSALRVISLLRTQSKILIVGMRLFKTKNIKGCFGESYSQVEIDNCVK